MASSIASMTMARSISFSRATASAMASSSALLAAGPAVAGAAVAIVLTFHLNEIGALGVEGGGGFDQRVGQQQLGRGDGGKRDGADALRRGDADRVAVDALDAARHLPGAVDVLGELEARVVPGPV